MPPSIVLKSPAPQDKLMQCWSAYRRHFTIDPACSKLSNRDFAARRSLVSKHQLDGAIRRLQGDDETTQEQTELANVYHTLMRMWVEP